MPTGVKITGLDGKQVDKVISKYFRGDLEYEQSLEAAVKISLNIVKRKARIILKNEVYDKPGADDHQRLLSGELYKKLRSKVLQIGKGVAAGELIADSPEAKWLEDGTRPHEVAAVNAEVMHWIGAGGEDAFSKKHEISGVTAIHFMRDALALAAPEIRETFLMVFGNAALAKGPLDFFRIGSGIVDDEDEITEAY